LRPVGDPRGARLAGLPDVGRPFTTGAAFDGERSRQEVDMAPVALISFSALDRRTENIVEGDTA
jgi:hypothetical protein